MLGDLIKGHMVGNSIAVISPLNHQIGPDDKVRRHLLLVPRLDSGPKTHRKRFNHAAAELPGQGLLEGGLNRILGVGLSLGVGDERKGYFSPVGGLTQVVTTALEKREVVEALGGKLGPPFGELMDAQVAERTTDEAVKGDHRPPTFIVLEGPELSRDIVDFKKRGSVASL